MTSDHLTNDQWSAIAPTVAKHFLGEPTKETDREIRWGRKGSKCLLKASGCLTDFENDPNRSLTVLELIETKLQTDRRGALDWLRREGIILEDSSRRNVGRSKRRSVRSNSSYGTRADRASSPPKPKPQKQTEPGGEVEKAQRFWAESEPIPNFVFENPAWQWVTVGDKPGIVEPGGLFPGVIRWHKRQGFFVAGRNTFDAWIKDEFEPFSVAVVAIDRQGKKRLVFHNGPGGDKRTFGSGADGVFIGDPQSQKIGICEGIADALALYNVFGIDAVWATNSAITKVINTPGACQWLASREVVLFTDADVAGQEAGDKAKSAILRWSPQCLPQVVCKYPFGAKDAAAVAAYQSTWAYEVNEKSGMLIDSGLPVSKADRLALQYVIGRYEND